jgi:hypothetical protein
VSPLRLPESAVPSDDVPLIETLDTPRWNLDVSELLAGVGPDRWDRGQQVATYLQWRSQADHEAYKASPEVATEGKEWVEFIEAGKAAIEVCAYEVGASAEAP